MRPESVEFLKELVEAPSPSGFEQPAQRLMREQMAKYADEVTTDVMGNVIGVRNREGKPRVMLAGHCDEIGLMVKYITDDGYLRVAPIGGWDARILMGHRVVIHADQGPVLGIIGAKAVHQMEPEEKKQVPSVEKLWVDIGAANRKDAEKRVSAGDPATVAVGFEMVTRDIAVSRGFDDKMGSFAVAEVLRLLSRRKHQASVFAVSTVQEEVGLRGAHTSTFGIDPQVAIAIDVGQAADFPGADKAKVGDNKVGKGPIIYRGANINPVVYKLMIEAAKEAKIPYQSVGAPGPTGTDGAVMQTTRSGVATAVISLALRYMHTPVEMLSLSDLDNISKLVAAFITKLTPDTDFTP